MTGVFASPSTRGDLGSLVSLDTSPFTNSRSVTFPVYLFIAPSHVRHRAIRSSPVCGPLQDPQYALYSSTTCTRSPSANPNVLIGNSEKGTRHVAQ